MYVAFYWFIFILLWRIIRCGKCLFFCLFYIWPTVDYGWITLTWGFHWGLWECEKRIKQLMPEHTHRGLCSWSSRCVFKTSYVAFLRLSNREKRSRSVVGLCVIMVSSILQPNAVSTHKYLTVVIHWKIFNITDKRYKIYKIFLESYKVLFNTQRLFGNKLSGLKTYYCILSVIVFCASIHFILILIFIVSLLCLAG